MELFYAPPSQIDQEKNQLCLIAQEFFHATKVLRHKQGDLIHCIDGLGTRYDAEILSIEKSQLSGGIVAKFSEPEMQTKVTVAISLTKTHDRFENFLEKATELGVSEIIPMITHRTVSRPNIQKREGKNERWEKIILAATKQSQRYRIPTLHPIQLFSSIVQRQDDLKLIPYERSTEKGFPHLIHQRVLFLIGGEGGFTEEEVAIAKTHGFLEISFGRTILRVDTAGLFAISLVRAEELRRLN